MSTTYEKIALIQRSTCPECKAEATVPCDRSVISEWLAIPVVLVVGIMRYQAYVEFHMTRVVASKAA